MKELVFPLKLGSSVNEWSDLFPARHGRVSFGTTTFEKKSEKLLSKQMTRVVTALHFEFSQFHKRISLPLTDPASDTGLNALLEYALAVVERIEQGKKSSVSENDQDNEYSSLCRSGLLLELVHITLVEQPEFAACRLPRWLMRHGGFEVEPLVLLAESSWKDDSSFWKAIKILSIMDLTPVVSQLLVRYLEESDSMVARSSIQLLLAFFEEVPSLFDIGASAHSVEEGMHAIEKRRQMASVAFFRDKHVSCSSALDKEPLRTINFIWRLIINVPEDYDFLLEQLMLVEGLEWYGKTALAWTWLHTVDEPSQELLANLGREIAPVIKADAVSASAIDALIFAAFSGDTLSLLSLLIPEQAAFGGKPFLAILIDIVFYAGALPTDIGPKLRDTVLMEYCHWLISSASFPSALGLRLSADIVQTLSEEASVRGMEEIIGRLAKRGTREWFTCLKILEVSPSSSSSLAESISLEKFHAHLDQNEFLDAIHSLAVAAEVGPDVHIGACRISDFVDQFGAQILKALETASEASAKYLIDKSVLLPEYIESGRFQFYSQYVAGKGCVQSLVKLAVSPNCPPELLVPLITEIRQTCLSAANEGKAIMITQEQTIALCKVLIDTQEPSQKVSSELLLAWLATEAFTMRF